MGDSKFFRLISILLLLLVVQGWSKISTDLITDPSSPDLDDFLLEHSIYGEEKIETISGCSTPDGGKVATADEFISSAKCEFLTKVWARYIDGRWNANTVHKDTIFCEIQNQASDFDIKLPGAVVIGPIDYTDVNKQPIFPNLNSPKIKFEGTTGITSNGTYSAGSYTELLTKSGANITLEAGTYFFNKIDLDDANTITITHKGGDYTTIIYVDTLFNMNNKSKFIVDDPEGYGKVLIMYRGTKAFNIVSSGEIHASIIAPYATVKFNSGAKLIGQALAKVVSLNNFNGSEGLDFKKLVKANIIISPDEINEDPDMIANVTKNNISTINFSLTKAVPSGLGIDNFPHKVTIDWELLDGDQKWGTDYVSSNNKSGQFTFLEGQKDTSINIEIIDEKVLDDNQSFSIRFFNATDNIEKFQVDFGSGATDTTHVIKINNDDNNTKPKSISLDPSNIYEEVELGSGKDTVGTITVQDDQEDPFKSTIAVTKGGAFFKVIKNSNNIYKLVANDTFDYEVGPRSYNIELTATDEGGLASNAFPFTIDINPINDLPIATTNVTFPVAENGSILDESLLPYITSGLDSVYAENILKYQIVDQPKHHSTFTPPSTYSKTQLTGANFSYTPNPALEVVKDSFSYILTDSTSYDTDVFKSAKTWVVFNITPVNDNDPVIVNKTLKLFEGETKSVGNLFTDGDSGDTHVLNILSQTNPTAGKATVISGNKIRYATTSDKTIEIFSDVVTFSVTDSGGLGKTVQGTLNVKIYPKNDNAPDPTIDTIEVTQGDITSYEHDIVIGDNGNGPDIDLDKDTVATTKNDLTIIDVTGKDDTYCDNLTYTKNKIKYIIKSNVNIPVGGAIDTLVYTIEDPVDPQYDVTKHPGSDTVFVKILRNPDSDPIAEADNITVKEGQAITFNVMTNDGKKLAELKNVAIATNPANGTITPVGDSSFTYTHDDSETESDSFTYTLWDEAGYFATATVNITIELLNDNDPVVTGQIIPIKEGELDKEFTVVTTPSIEKDTDLYTSFTTDTTGFGANGGAKYGTLIKVDEFKYKYSQDKIAVGVDEDTVFMYVHDNVGYDATLRSQIDTTIFTITPSNDSTPWTTPLNVTLKELEDTVISLLGSGGSPDLIGDNDMPDDVLSLTIKSQTNHAGTAVFDNAAKTITYTADPDTLTEKFADTLVYTITDDASHAADDTIFIAIEHINDNGPIAVMDTVNVYVGSKSNIAPLVNDTDADEDKSKTDLKLDSPAIVTQPTKATKSFTVTGNIVSIEYDPALVTAATVDSFEYKIIDPVSYPDPTVKSATGWVYINVLFPDNTLPTAVDDEINVDENLATSTLVSGATSLKANDIPSVDFGSALEDVAIVTNVQHGDLTLNPSTGEFTYDHHDDKEIFFDFFTYTVTDADGYTSPPATVTITINKKNDNPAVMTGESISVDEGDSKTVDIFANDLDPDKDVQTQFKTSINTAKPATLGTVTKNADGTFTYQHNGDENPVVGDVLDSFFVTVVDTNEYDTNIHTTENKVLVTISPVVNKTPNAGDGAFPDINEGESTKLDISSLYSDDDMPNDVLTLEIVNKTTPAGTATIVDDTVFYSHTLSTEIFVDNIIYKVTDSKGNSDNGTLTIKINPLNDNSPIANADTISVRQGTPLTFNVTKNDDDADVEFDSTFFKIFSNTDPERGTVVKVDDSTFTYTMNIDFEIEEGVSDVDSFTYIVEDSVPYHGVINKSDPGLVYIKLLRDEQGYPKTLNDALTLQENDSVSSVWSIMDNDTMGFAALRSINIVDDVDHGKLTVDPVTGVFTYDHDNDKEEFTDQFIYTLTDVVGNVSNAALVTLTIDTLNDNSVTPENEHVSVDEGRSIEVDVLTTERNTDKDILTTLQTTLKDVNGGALYGTASITADGILTYTNGNAEGITSDKVVVTITDPVAYDTTIHELTDTVFITINSVNDSTPSGTAPAYNILEGGTLAIIDSAAGLLHDATDGDLGAGNSLSAVLVTKPIYHNVATAGEFTINPNGTFTYVHDDSENFKDAIVYDISDGLNTIRLTAVINIAPVNDNAPTALPDTYMGIEGGTISPVTSVLANDNDIDLYLDGMGGTITTPLHAVVDPLQLPTQGTVIMTNDGLFTYTHNGSETVNDSFAYTVVDTMQGITFTNTAKVYITIPQVAPVADSAFYYDEDGNGVIEEVIVHFNDSIDVATTTFTASWEKDAAPVTVLSATNVGVTGTEVSLVLDGSPVHRTSGILVVGITHGANFDNLVASVRAQDKAAPTITAATYYYDETALGNDSIRVFFSEDVSNFTGNPYNYLDVTTGAEFSMEVTLQSHVGSVMTYKVNSKTIKQVNTGDSIQIKIADIALDTLDNYQDLTIWAPITLEGKYPVDFEFMIVPQPMLFIKIGDKKQEPAPLNEGMMEYYNFPATAPKKGVAFILYAKMPLADASLQKCTYTILDQTGNVVQEAQPLTFTLNADSEMTGVGVWEGKNKNGRIVAKSSYLVVVDAEIVTENGEIVPYHTEKPIATYGIYE